MRDLTTIQAVFRRPPASLVFGEPDQVPDPHYGDDAEHTVARSLGSRPGLRLELLGAPEVFFATLGMAAVATPEAGRDLALPALLFHVLYPNTWMACATWYAAQLGRLGAAPAVGFTADMPDGQVRLAYDPAKRHVLLHVLCGE